MWAAWLPLIKVGTPPAGVSDLARCQRPPNLFDRRDRLIAFGKASEPFDSVGFVSNDHVAGARSNEGRVTPSNRSFDRRAHYGPKVKLAS